MSKIIYKGYIIELSTSDFHPRKNQDNLTVLMLEDNFKHYSEISEEPKNLVGMSSVYVSSSGHLNVLGGSHVGKAFITKETQENTGVLPENFIKEIILELNELNRYIHGENFEASVYKIPEKVEVEDLGEFNNVISSAKKLIDRLELLDNSEEY